MIVFIPHPSEESVLARAQKTILSRLDSRDCLWFPCGPLWIIPDAPCETIPVEWYRSAAQKLTVLVPETRGTALVFPAVLDLNDGTHIRCTVRAAERNGASQDQTIPDEADLRLPDFPLSCRVFRAADAQFTPLPDLRRGMSWCVLRSCWVKTY
jgi:hypothetical protein